MDLKLQLLETFPAQGSDGKAYKVCAYERMRRDDSVHDGHERWLSTGVTELRLDDGGQVAPRTDGTMTVLHTGITLTKD